MPEPAILTPTAVYNVAAVAWGDATGLDGGRLTLAQDDLAGFFAAPALAGVRFSWASPGDSVRIVKVLDAVEPRTRKPEDGGAFPGFVSPARAGGGAVHALRGVAVVAAGYLPRGQESVVEMSGPGAALSPLGRTHNLVVEFTPAPGADWVEVDRAVRAGLLRAAARRSGLPDGGRTGPASE